MVVPKGHFPLMAAAVENHNDQRKLTIQSLNFLR
jgi:hypothetical protein